MKFTRFAALALALLIGGSLGIAAANHDVVETTSAAWTDQTQIDATATAGSWTTATPNTCVAYKFSGEKSADCQVSGITFYGWGEPGKQTRNYYVNFKFDPLKVNKDEVNRITFDVDLSTATGQATTWSWKNARVQTPAQFTPRDGWTCAEFPRVRGTAAENQRDAIYFVVYESSGGQPAGCSW